MKEPMPCGKCSWSILSNDFESEIIKYCDEHRKEPDKDLLGRTEKLFREVCGNSTKSWVTEIARFAQEVRDELKDKLVIRQRDHYELGRELENERKLSDELAENLDVVYEWFLDIKEKQEKLLVTGQTFESASKNWEEASTLDKGLDFEPIVKALEAHRKARE